MSFEKEQIEQQKLKDKEERRMRIADPMNAEVQKKIEEGIRLENVQRSMEQYKYYFTKGLWIFTQKLSVRYSSLLYFPRFICCI